MQPILAARPRIPASAEEKVRALLEAAVGEGAPDVPSEQPPTDTSTAAPPSVKRARLVPEAMERAHRTAAA
nr:hypothetical protein GCM10010200_032990 [Actinomadura rugatobispora]